MGQGPKKSKTGANGGFSTDDRWSEGIIIVKGNNREVATSVIKR